MRVLKRFLGRKPPLDAFNRIMELEDAVTVMTFIASDSTLTTEKRLAEILRVGNKVLKDRRPW